MTNLSHGFLLINHDLLLKTQGSVTQGKLHFKEFTLVGQ